jgi:hypothetical protein
LIAASRAIEARELFEEGFHIPLTHLIREGRVDETLVALLRANVRTPDQTVGDIWAQVSANELMRGAGRDLPLRNRALGRRAGKCSSIRLKLATLSNARARVSPSAN